MKKAKAKSTTEAAAPKAPAKKAAPKKTAPKTQRITFSVRAELGSRVFLAGSFNDWDPTAKELVDKKGDGTFTVIVALVPGDHQYKFVIDGTWCVDPENPEWVQNDHGTLNSVKHV